MTPERRAEIAAMIKWWKQVEHIRVNGFKQQYDPLFIEDRKHINNEKS